MMASSGRAQDTAVTSRNAADIGVVYPISSEGASSRHYTNTICLSLVYGISRNVSALALGGFGTIVKDSVHGAQIGGFFNSAARVEGGQVAGFLNIDSTLRGAQIAGFFNHASRVKGVQVAGFLNIDSALHGAQIAGFCNKAAAVKGVQAAGFLNIAATVKGIQVAGFLNKATTVHGVQIAGLINIADSSDYPIGVLNFVRNGEKSIDLSVDETSTFLAAFRSGGRILYGIAGIGYNGKDNHSLYALEAGIGAHIPVTPRFRVNAEATSLTMVNFKSGQYFKSSVGVFPAYRLGRHMEVFAGPTINWITWTKELGEGLGSAFLWSKTKGTDFSGLSLGASGGIRAIF